MGTETDLRTQSSVSGFSRFEDDTGVLLRARFFAAVVIDGFVAYLPDSREIT